MSVTLKTLSISAERPLDPITSKVLLVIDELLRSAGIPYMLVGATARDLLLYHVCGFPVTRATNDLDFAILVDSWEQFVTVKRLLAASPGFVDKEREIQRLYYTPSNTTFETKIDIIPFGKLETVERKIEWPPDADVVMNVAAFADVFASSVLVQVGPEVSISVASLPGIVVLKLFAWLDRKDDRDVADLLRLMETYTDAGNEHRLFEEESEELERVSFDTTLAGAYLLGKDANRITDQKTRKQLSDVLSGRTDELIRRLALKKGTFDDQTEYAATLLLALFRGLGLNEIPHQES